MEKCVVKHILAYGNRVLGYRYGIYRGRKLLYAVDVSRGIDVDLLPLFNNVMIRKGKVLQGVIDSNGRYSTGNGSDGIDEITNVEAFRSLLDKYYFGNVTPSNEGVIRLKRCDRMLGRIYFSIGSTEYFVNSDYDYDDYCNTYDLYSKKMLDNGRYSDVTYVSSLNYDDTYGLVCDILKSEKLTYRDREKYLYKLVGVLRSKGVSI